MASVAATPMTAEEFFTWANRPENRDRRFELDRGEIVAMSLPGERHCAVCGNVTGIFWNYTRQRRQGYVCPNDMGLVLERDPDTVRGADVAVYTETKKYEELSPKYSERLPGVVVEVLSPNDQLGRMMRRINQFLARGVQLVWLVDPEARTVTVCRAGEIPQVLEETETLTGFDLLPGFSCRVAEFFAIPGE